MTVRKLPWSIPGELLDQCMLDQSIELTQVRQLLWQVSCFVGIVQDANFIADNELLLRVTKPLLDESVDDILESRPRQVNFQGSIQNTANRTVRIRLP